jgi:hypothetical protein
MPLVLDGTNGVSGVNGSASSPAFEGTDADSGIFINSANEVNASLNSTPVWSAVSTFGFKNRLINSAMVIDQRNNGASVTANNAAGQVYTLDRWCARSVTPSTSGAFTIQQSSVVPTGFNSSLLATVSVAATPASTDQFFIQQRIEGFNIADLGLGTAAPSTFTLSFWVRSSVTGSFGGNVGNNVNLAYPFSFTINAANTWEQKTVTIVGPTTGTWNTTNGTGLIVHFSLGAGASNLGTANTWANYPVAPTGSVNLISTSGATFYITGVQLEKGSTATSFDYRPYGTELVLCQRYCIPYGLGYSNARIAYGSWGSSTQAFVSFPFPVEMRVTPGFTLITSGALLLEGVAWYAVTGTPILLSESSNKLGIAIVSVAASGASAGQVAIWGEGGVSQARCIFAAEL